jgi:hypothetical protein
VRYVRWYHVVLITVGIILSGVMLALLLPKWDHWAPPPPAHERPLGPPGTEGLIQSPPAHHAAHAARRSREHQDGGGGLSFNDVRLIFDCSLLVGILAATVFVVHVVRRRLAFRGSRQYGLYEIKLSLHDQTRPLDLLKMVEQLANAVRAFPERRGRDGQPFVAFESHIARGVGGELEWVPCVRCERAMAATIDSQLSSAYPDVRLGFEFSGPPQEIIGSLREPGHVLRFCKARSFVHPTCDLTATPKKEGSPRLEAIALAQAALNAPSTVRIQLMPTMLILERWARERARGHEEDQATEKTQSGTLSREEQAATAKAQNQAWFWVEIQVAADTREQASQVAAALQAQRGANRLRTRSMGLREDLYRRRFASAYPPLWPAVSCRSLLSAAEVADLIELPGARMKSVPVRRLAVPRIPAPPEVLLMPDDPEPALPLTDTDGQTGT